MTESFKNRRGGGVKDTNHEFYPLEVMNFIIQPDPVVNEVKVSFTEWKICAFQRAWYADKRTFPLSEEGNGKPPHSSFYLVKPLQVQTSLSADDLNNNNKLLEASDNLPNKICPLCSNQLDDAYNFIMQFEASQEKLKVDFHQKTEQLVEKDVERNDSDLAEKESENCLAQAQCNTARIDGERSVKSNINIGLRPKNVLLKRITSTFNDCNIFECRICFCVFKNRNEIHAHMKKHSNKLLQHKDVFKEYLNGLCSEQDVHDLITKITTGNEIDGANIGEPFFNQCQLCPAIFATKAKLSKHIQRHCETDNSIKRSVSNSDNHRNKTINPVKKKNMVEKSNGDSEFCQTAKISSDESKKCEMCGKIFDSKKSYYIHFKNHFSAKLISEKIENESNSCTYKCRTCDKVFLKESNFRKHASIHTLNKLKRTYYCEVCGKQYVSLIARETHKLKHNPNYELICEFCPHKFKLKKSFQEHLKIHLKTGTHSCMVCHIKFISAEELKIHEHVEHKLNNDGLIKCQSCEEYFDDILAYNEHLLTHEIEEGAGAIRQEIGTINSLIGELTINVEMKMDQFRYDKSVGSRLSNKET